MATADDHIRWAQAAGPQEEALAHAQIATAMNLGRIADAIERIVREEFDDPDYTANGDVPADFEAGQDR